MTLLFTIDGMPRREKQNGAHRHDRKGLLSIFKFNTSRYFHIAMRSFFSLFRSLDVISSFFRIHSFVFQTLHVRDHIYMIVRLALSASSQLCVCVCFPCEINIVIPIPN